MKGIHDVMEDMQISTYINVSTMDLVAGPFLNSHPKIQRIFQVIDLKNQVKPQAAPLANWLSAEAYSRGLAFTCQG